MNDNTPRSDRRRLTGALYAALALMALALLAACGPEAPQAIDPPATATRQAIVVLPTATRPTDSERPRPSGVTPAPAPTDVPDSAPTDSDPTADSDPRTQGDPDAPIVVVEFSDFQCPFCASFSREVRPLIEERYVSAGKVRFVYRDFPLMSIHPGALLAAHVANCAGEQGAFWQMHNRIFAGMERREWGSGNADDFRTFLRYADELNIDAAQVQQCVESNRYSARIQSDILEGQQAGVRSTPSFLINGQLLVGAQPFEVWERILETILNSQ
ncbi:thioredoxin domain-containing protein [Roseiflexus sp.]|uniref:DsbA family protein n=1 Tax=Roseiflexus sp. TaxID=2562120 RepID=UPI00398B315D